MKTEKPLGVRKSVVSLDTTLPGLFKTFIEGGITSLSNKHLKGLSREFQQNAIAMCETIIKHGTDQEKQLLIQIYNNCVKRAR